MSDDIRSREELEEYLADCANMPYSPWEGGVNSIGEYADALKELVERYHDCCDVSCALYGIQDLLSGDGWEDDIGEDVVNNMQALGKDLIQFINKHPGSSLYNEARKTFGGTQAPPSAPEPF